MLTYDMGSRGELSKYEYLYRCIRMDIERGTIAAQDRLPSKRAFAAHLGVSVITVEQAYDQLVAEGYLYTRPRSGYFASELPQLPKAKAVRSPHVAVSADRPVEPPVVADFTQGAPFNDRAFSLWARSLRQVIASEEPAESFEGVPSKGSWRLRCAIARHLEGSRGMAVEPSDIVVGAGSQVLYGLLVQLLGRDGGYAIEDPGYPALAKIYRAQGAHVFAVALDGQGMSVEGLEASGANVAHVMPSHQYPTGIVCAIARRYELLGWATAAENRYIVEDDYDCEFRLAGRPVPALASVDTAGRVIYLNTFARSIGPTLRVAYMVLPPDLSARYDVDLGFYANTVSALTQVALARLIEDGSYERSVNRMRTAHRALRDRLADIVRTFDSTGTIRLEQADSGLHCVLAIQTERDEREIAIDARRRGVVLAPLADFCHDPANYGRFKASLGDSRARFPLNYSHAIEHVPSLLASLRYS